MNYQFFKTNRSKEFLGFCEQKGFVYSVRINTRKYAVVSLQNGQVTELIQFIVQPCAIQVKA